MGYKLYNHYGPTETTVDAIVCECNTSQNLIGKPISNIKVYITDENSKLMPIGEVGEICIAGDGLTKGYLNNPELTRLKFLPCPFKEGGILDTAIYRLE